MNKIQFRNNMSLFIFILFVVMITGTITVTSILLYNYITENDPYAYNKLEYLTELENIYIHEYNIDSPADTVLDKNTCQ